MVHPTVARVEAERKRLAWTRARICSEIGLSVPSWDRWIAGRSDPLAVYVRAMDAWLASPRREAAPDPLAESGQNSA